MESKETFESLRSRIMQSYDGLSPHLQRIASLALDQPNLIALQTVAGIAERVEVQPSTLIRFAKELGYDGFSQMQRVFKLRLIEGLPRYRDEIYEERSASASVEDLGAIMARCIDASIASLQAVRQSADPADLGRAVEMLRSANHIYVAGLRRARPVATYFAYGLNRLECNCSILDFGGGMAMQQVANMSHDDLLVAVAFAEYSPPVVDVVRDAALRSHRILALTDVPSSPLARDGSLVFLVDQDVSGEFRPLAGAIGLVQALMIALRATV